MSGKRLNDIDRAKGVAIFLVVLGHLFSVGVVPPQHEWYTLLKYSLYTFHMSFFMFLSGYIAFYSLKKIHSFFDYKQYLEKRFWRLIPAYVLFSIVVFVGKATLQNIVHVDNSISSVFSFLDIFILPGQSFSRFLWYIYIIFIFYAITPLILMISRQKIWPAFLFSLALYFFPRTELFGIDHIETYFVDFMLGILLGSNQERYTSWLDRYGLFCLIAFSILLSIARFIHVPGFMPFDDPAPIRLLIGFLSIPSIHWIVRLKGIRRFSVIEWMGKYVFPIYLMNTIAIGGVKAILFQFLNIENDFLILSLLLLLAGILIPIFVKQKLFSMIPRLDAITH